MHEPDFYIGYQPRAPRALARFVTTAAVGLVAVGAVIAGVLLAGIGREVPKTFEYGIVRDWTGTLVARPLPILIAPDGSGYLLVSPGKHGFEVRDVVRQTVQLRGTFIGFGSHRMLEVMSPPTPHAGSIGERPPAPLGRVTLEGEVVDTKCYFGVMQPGAGKVHRDCAARCIAGGIPPGLLVRDASGQLEVVLLAANNSAQLRTQLVPFAGDRIAVAGQLSRGPAGLILETSLQEEQQPWNIPGQQ